MVLGVQIGELDEMAGAAGAALMTTFCVAVAEVHPATTTYSEYTPLMAAVALPRVGSSTPEVQPPGPDQTYVAPGKVGPFKMRVVPAQIGLLVVKFGCTELLRMVMFCVATAEVHPATTTYSV